MSVNDGGLKPVCGRLPPRSAGNSDSDDMPIAYMLASSTGCGDSDTVAGRCYERVQLVPSLASITYASRGVGNEEYRQRDFDAEVCTCRQHWRP